MTGFSNLPEASWQQVIGLMAPPPTGTAMGSTHWRGGVSPSTSWIVSAATNDDVRKITPNFYGTNPMR